MFNRIKIKELKEAIKTKNVKQFDIYFEEDQSTYECQ